METIVKRARMREVLTAAKSQFISIAICNKEGHWSEQFFDIHDIQEFKSGTGKVLVLVVSSSTNSGCMALDATYIRGLRFNKYLNLDGDLIERIGVHAKEELLDMAY